MDFLADILVMLGRLCISCVFIWGAIDRVMNWKGSTASQKTKNIPYIHLIYPAFMFLQAVGALLILFGFSAHIGAPLLILVLVPSALYLHNFWKHTGMERKIEKHLFMKDVSIFGALLILLALGSSY
jgi:putative oxidoreductase